MIRIKQGLDVPISGSPEGKITDSEKIVRSVGLIGSDYHGLKPKMLVKQGDKVKLGQPLFLDKTNPDVVFTSPAGGKIESINRGPRRTLQSVIVEINENEEQVIFDVYNKEEIKSIEPSIIKKNLVKSGLWTSLLTRPYSKIPKISQEPEAIFVNAMDTNPLAINPEIIISIQQDFFDTGINILKRLTKKKIHVCTAANSSLKVDTDNQVHQHFFSGPHPAGLTGTHMHFVSPASLSNFNWSINYSDLIAFGEFFLKGKIPKYKYISLAGPLVQESKIIKTRVGACTDEICAGEVEKIDSRIISGSVISGREAIGPFAYLGRYHNQISVIQEATTSDRELFDWMRLGKNRFSKLPLFISSFYKEKKYNMKTLMYGPDRAILPIEVYEQVFPLNMLITLLLRYIAIGDTEKIQSLGALELDEEDLALCSFVCPSKYDFGSLLRDNLSRIEIEG